MNQQTFLSKDGDNMAIVTTEDTREGFYAAFICLLSRMIEEGSFDGDWEFQLTEWLPQFAQLAGTYEKLSNVIQGQASTTVSVALVSGNFWADAIVATAYGTRVVKIPVRVILDKDAARLKRLSVELELKNTRIIELQNLLAEENKKRY